MSEVQQFRKKPVVVEAVRFTGFNIEEIAAFTGETPPHQSLAVLGETALYKITTLEGQLFASPGDWIIRGVQGEYYPCKPDIFAETYEPVQAVSSTDEATKESVLSGEGGVNESSPARRSADVTSEAERACVSLASRTSPPAESTPNAGVSRSEAAQTTRGKVS